MYVISSVYFRSMAAVDSKKANVRASVEVKHKGPTWMLTHIDSETRLYSINSDEKKTIHEWLDFFGVTDSYHFGLGQLMVQGKLPLLQPKDLGSTDLSGAKNAKETFYDYPLVDAIFGTLPKNPPTWQIAVSTLSRFDVINREAILSRHPDLSDKLN